MNGTVTMCKCFDLKMFDIDIFGECLSRYKQTGQFEVQKSLADSIRKEFERKRGENMEERHGRGEKRAAVSLDMETDERSGARAKSLHRRTRSQSISTRARMGPPSAQSSRRGSMETLQIEGEKVKFDAEAF